MLWCGLPPDTFACRTGVVHVGVMMIAYILAVLVGRCFLHTIQMERAGNMADAATAVPAIQVAMIAAGGALAGSLFTLVGQLVNARHTRRLALAQIDADKTERERDRAHELAVLDKRLADARQEQWEQTRTQSFMDLAWKYNAYLGGLPDEPSPGFDIDLVHRQVAFVARTEATRRAARDAWDYVADVHSQLRDADYFNPMNVHWCRRYVNHFEECARWELGITDEEPPDLDHLSGPPPYEFDWGPGERLTRHPC